MNTRLSRKRRQTRDRIAQAAFALFETRGYAAVTMEQIASAADVVRGTLYNHFAVKDAVLVYGLHAQLERDLDALLPQALSRRGIVAQLASLLEPSMQWWEANRQYAAPYIRHRFQDLPGTPAEAADGDGSAMTHAYARLIATAQANGELRSDIPSERMARHLHYLYLGAMVAWLGTPGLALGDEFAQALEFFLEGAAPR